MSNSTWCDLNKNCTVLKLHDTCHNPKCNCQEQFTFTPKQFQLKVSGFKNTMKKFFKGTEKCGKILLNPDEKKLVPLFPPVWQQRQRTLIQLILLQII